jgi:hypothetical protein
MFYKDNWLSWTYNDGPEYGPKLTPNAKCKINLKSIVSRPIKSYYEELLDNARLIRDTFTGELDLLFSGGIDSEIILRVYLELKIPINVYIFKYENDYNYIEFNLAVKICEELSVTPTIIDFQLQKFFENEAYNIWTKVYSNNGAWLPHMKMTEYVDGLPIIGMGEPYWGRTSKDWNSKHSWNFEMWEGPHYCALYHRTIGRPVISDWYEYSPEIILSHLELPIVKDLLDDKIPGKYSSWSSRLPIHRAYWPTIPERPKLVGFEGRVPKKDTVLPEFMVEFSNKYNMDSVSSTKDSYTKEQLLNLIGTNENI